ncbi:MAG: hypothetical protein K6G36_03080 [Candidatus Saccharibacteria bacterium]|nr:hypothetical protein [Candidatus Saccharibacteria bacterium]
MNKTKTVNRKILGDLPEAFVKLFDEVAARTMPAFCRKDDFEPYLAFTIKRTYYHDGGTTHFDGVEAESVIYTTSDGDVFPDRPIDYVNWSIGGPETHTVITPSPSSLCDEDGVLSVSNEFYTCFIEVANACDVEKLKGGRGRVSCKGREGDIQLCLLDRAKNALMMRLLLPGEFALASPTLIGLYPHPIEKLGVKVDRMETIVKEAVATELKKALSETIESL